MTICQRHHRLGSDVFAAAAAAERKEETFASLVENIDHRNMTQTAAAAVAVVVDEVVVDFLSYCYRYYFAVLLVDFGTIRFLRVLPLHFPL